MGSQDYLTFRHCYKDSGAQCKVYSQLRLSIVNGRKAKLAEGKVS